MSVLLVQISVLFIRAVLAVLLVSAGAAKLVDLTSFANTLIGLGVPARQNVLVRGLALGVPCLELILGLALVSGLWPTITNIIVLIVMCSFSIVVLIALKKAPHVACRCFGALSDSQFSVKGLARSLLLVVLAIVVFWKGSTYAPQLSNSLGAFVLLIVGYLVFAVGAAQAAKTIATLKARMAA